MTRFLFDHRTLSHEKDVGWAKARERCAHHLPAIACDVVSTLAPPRHCERSEAIQKWIRGKTLDCFATLAMTMWVQSLPKLSSRAPDAAFRVGLLAWIAIAVLATASAFIAPYN
jgi:hypothetical protein